MVLGGARGSVDCSSEPDRGSLVGLRDLPSCRCRHRLGFRVCSTWPPLPLCRTTRGTLLALPSPPGLSCAAGCGSDPKISTASLPSSRVHCVAPPPTRSASVHSPPRCRGVRAVACQAATSRSVRAVSHRSDGLLRPRTLEHVAAPAGRGVHRVCSGDNVGDPKAFLGRRRGSPQCDTPFEGLRLVDSRTPSLRPLPSCRCPPDASGVGHARLPARLRTVAVAPAAAFPLPPPPSPRLEDPKIPTP